MLQGPELLHSTQQLEGVLCVSPSSHDLQTAAPSLQHSIGLPGIPLSPLQTLAKCWRTGEGVSCKITANSNSFDFVPQKNSARLSVVITGWDNTSQGS